MISVFFRCNCPFAGYVQRKVDYINQRLTECSKQEMTYTGYSLFRSSGSYMILANFEGRRYFHSRQSKSTALDDQNRPVRNNVVFVGNSPEDDLTVSRLAGYALLKEAEFYKEIASMITLKESEFEVDYETLKAFLKRFETDFSVESPNAADKKMCEDIFFKRTNNDVDFIVLEADLDFLNKQLGRVAKVQYAFDYKEMQELNRRVKLTLPDAPSVVVSCVDITANDGEQALTENAGSTKKNEIFYNTAISPAVKEVTVCEKNIAVENALDEEEKKVTPEPAATKPLNDSKTELASLDKKVNTGVDKNTLLFGIAMGAVMGVISTLLLAWIMKLIV